MSVDLQARLQALREAFLKELPARLAALRRAWEGLEGNRQGDLLFEAHRLAGAAGTFGQPMLSEAARDLEELLRASDAPDAAAVEAALAEVESTALRITLPVPEVSPGGDLAP
ncbi:MAG TPA: Hpt domain-containing protein, partial [Holophagaceae bacterium]|nr:Hpt domain-containing protein [Holophagaceae bacterium]